MPKTSARRSLALPLLAMLPLALGCAAPDGGGGRAAGDGRPLRVVTTIGMIADAARAVAGPHAEVEA